MHDSSSFTNTCWKGNAFETKTLHLMIFSICYQMFGNYYRNRGQQRTFRKQQKTSKDEDLDCWTILSESTLLVSASFGDWTILVFRMISLLLRRWMVRKHRPPTLGHFLQMSCRLLMASSTPTAFRHEWISLVLSTKKRLGSKKY